jgi:hypothetical protein
MSKEPAKGVGEKKESRFRSALSSLKKAEMPSLHRPSQPPQASRGEPDDAAQCMPPTKHAPQSYSDHNADSEPPPSYDSIASSSTTSNTPAATGKGRSWFSQSSQPSSASQAGVSDDDRYGFLAQFDTILLVDDSGSMQGGRWTEACEALEAIARVSAKYDEDGLDLYFLNHRSTANPNPPPGKGSGGYYGIKTKDDVTDLFNRVRPAGYTPTRAAIMRIMMPYLAAYEKAATTGQQMDIRPLNIIVITDGSPTDPLAEGLTYIAEQLDRLHAPPSQVGIQFFQIGNDRTATLALKALDDDLRTDQNKKVRDYIDTVTWDDQHGHKLSPDTILKTVLGAVNRKLDNADQKGAPGRGGKHSGR